MQRPRLEAFYRRHGLPHARTLAQRFVNTHLLDTDPIHPAVVMRDAVGLLLRGSGEHTHGEAMQRNTHMWTVWLFDACQRGDLSAVHACLPCADLGAVDEQGNTVLHHAIKHWGMAQVVLEAGVDPDAKNMHGQTALDVACLVGMKESACTLLAYGADL